MEERVNAKRQNFNLDQLESNCRQQNKCINAREEKKMKIVLDRTENIVGKGENAGCWIPAFYPFPTMFSKGFFLRVVKKSEVCCKRVHGQADRINLRLESTFYAI